MSFIAINPLSPIPKYKQVIHSIENAITSGILNKGDQIPSINSIKNEHHLSRDTVLVAFNELKNRGVIQSIVGKGYYVLSVDVRVNQKVFLLFDEFNSFKKDLYNSFMNTMGEHTQIDIFFHHFNNHVFNKLIIDNVGDYSAYVIMPASLKNTSIAISKLPENKVYILDQLPNELNRYPGVYQNFKKNVYEGLLAMLDNIKKYQKLVLLYSKVKEPLGILNGFQLFCNEFQIENEIIDTLKGRTFSKGEIYFLLEDESLIKVVKEYKEQNFIIAEDYGIISYNDTLLKEIIEGGITTITTNFIEMGEQLATMISSATFAQIENQNSILIRKSI